jgi:SAM-dependent methyltransferase
MSVVVCDNPVNGFPLDFVTVSKALGRYEETTDTARRIARLVPLEQFPHVIDICCGFGRMAAALHHMGYSVAGFDLSEDQIALAKLENPGPRYFVADMRSPPAGRYDAAINLYTSFGYFKTEVEDFHAIQAWAGALRPGGRLIMELADMDRARARLEKGGAPTRRVTGDVSEEFVMNWKTRVFRVTYRQFGRELTLYTRLYEKEHIADMLSKAGFVDIQLYGDFSRKLKKPGDDLIVVATRL